jgi:hypothetical protein
MSNKESKDSVTFAVDSRRNFTATLKMAEGKNTIQSYVSYLLLVKYSLANFTVDSGANTTPIINTSWNRTLLHIRSIIEFLGGTDKKATINISGSKYEFWIDKNYAYVKSKKNAN